MEHVGKHTLEFLAPTVIAVVLDGDVSPSEASRLLTICNGCFAGIHGRLVVEFEKLGRIDAEARAALSSPHEPCKSCDLLLVGQSMQQKLVLTHVAGMASAWSPAPVSTHFFATREDALVWLVIGDEP